MRGDRRELRGVFCALSCSIAKEGASKECRQRVFGARNMARKRRVSDVVEILDEEEPRGGKVKS